MDGTMAILLIEDLQLAQIIAADIFKKLNCSLDIASNGVMALDMILQHQFDMIFMDIELPDMNGFEIIATIRSMERRGKHVPIVAVTANYYEQFDTKCHTAGFDDFLLKPLTIESVRHMLKKHIGGMVADFS